MLGTSSTVAFLLVLLASARGQFPGMPFGLDPTGMGRSSMPFSMYNPFSTMPSFYPMSPFASMSPYGQSPFGQSSFGQMSPFDSSSWMQQMMAAQNSPGNTQGGSGSNGGMGGLGSISRLLGFLPALDGLLDLF